MPNMHLIAQQLISIFSLTLPILLPGLTLIVIIKLNLLSSLDTPLDFGLSYRGKRIFGDNKTLRGAVVMVFMAAFVSYALYLGYWNDYASYIDPIFSTSPILLGTIYSVSYILGELVNSFVKRQMNISSGKITSTKFRNLQIFFDLSDGIIAAAIALLIFTSASVNHVMVAGLIGIFLHYSTDLLMKKLCLK